MRFCSTFPGLPRSGVDGIHPPLTYYRIAILSGNGVASNSSTMLTVQ